MSGFQRTAIACMSASIIVGAALSTTTAEQPDTEREQFQRLDWAPPSSDAVVQEPAKLPTPVDALSEEEEPPAIDMTQKALERGQGGRLSEADPNDMRAMTQQIISGLPAAPPPQQPTASDAASDPMLQSTNRVLEALNALNQADDAGDAAIAADAAQDLRLTLAELVAQAQAQGGSDDYVGRLLDEAIARRDAQVPSALQDSSGRLNTSALLASVAAAQSVQDTAEADPYLSAIASEGATTQVASIGGRVAEGVQVGGISGGLSTGAVSLGETRQDRYVTVQAGDTLGGIAIAAYGDALMYPRIFQANRDILRNPNDISIGQRLRVPY